MTRLPVTSKAIRSLGHAGTTLEVEFSSGHIYRYDGITPEHYAALLAAKSLGEAFHETVRKGGFAHEKVTTAS